MYWCECVCLFFALSFALRLKMYSSRHSPIFCNFFSINACAYTHTYAAICVDMCFWNGSSLVLCNLTLPPKAIKCLVGLWIVEASIFTVPLQLKHIHTHKYNLIICSTQLFAYVINKNICIYICLYICIMYVCVVYWLIELIFTSGLLTPIYLVLTTGVQCKFITIRRNGA